MTAGQCVNVADHVICEVVKTAKQACTIGFYGTVGVSAHPLVLTDEGWQFVADYLSFSLSDTGCEAWLLML